MDRLSAGPVSQRLEVRVKLNFGFVSARFSGIDGVSLESMKWAQMLQTMGHECFWFAGEIETPADISFHSESSRFDDPLNIRSCNDVFVEKKRTPPTTQIIREATDKIKQDLYNYVEKFHIDVLIAQNCLSLPMQLPLGLALTEFIAESRIHAIAHHHDFFWERSRYLKNACADVLEAAYPPKMPQIAHVTINSAAQRDLAHRCGLASLFVPNVYDFDYVRPEAERKGAEFREKLGLAESDKLILQPTRIIGRKGIEHAIYLINELNDPRAHLIITHPAGDEGFAYQDNLIRLAQKLNVKMTIAADLLRENNPGVASEELFCLWDAYEASDFVTYPSLYEGFGNAFLEAIYFRKPLLVNRYPVFIEDIEPCGFDVVTMDGFVDNNALSRVKDLLDNPERCIQMTDHNFNIAKKYFGYPLFKRKMEKLIDDFVHDVQLR